MFENWPNLLLPAFISVLWIDDSSIFNPIELHRNRGLYFYKRCPLQKLPQRKENARQVPRPSSNLPRLQQKKLGHSSVCASGLQVK